MRYEYRKTLVVGRPILDPIDNGYECYSAATTTRATAWAVVAALGLGAALVAGGDGELGVGLGLG